MQSADGTPTACNEMKFAFLFVFLVASTPSLLRHKKFWSRGWVGARGVMDGMSVRVRVRGSACACVCACACACACACLSRSQLHGRQRSFSRLRPRAVGYVAEDEDGGTLLGHRIGCVEFESSFPSLTS